MMSSFRKLLRLNVAAIMLFTAFPEDAASFPKKDKVYNILFVWSAAHRYGGKTLNANFAAAVAIAESAGNSDLLGLVGERGIMQVTKGACDDLGVDFEDVQFDPYLGAVAGVLYLERQWLDFDQDLDLTLSAYNCGPACTLRFNGNPAPQSKKYILRVKKYFHYLNRCEGYSSLRRCIERLID
jgi:soluble lytic murein transglycosylase-like protein